MTKQEKVELLMREYDTLRLEIQERIKNRFAFIGLGVAVAAFTFDDGISTGIAGWPVFVIVALVLFVVWWRIGHLIARLSDRIVEIERKVNKMAGEELLVWEQRSPYRKILSFFKIPRIKKK